MKKLIFALMGIVTLFTLQSCSKDDDPDPEPVTPSYYLTMSASFTDQSTCQDFYHYVMEYTVTEGSKAAVTKTIDFTKGEKFSNITVNAPASISYKITYVNVADPVADKEYDIANTKNITIYAMKKTDAEYLIAALVNEGTETFEGVLGSDLDKEAALINEGHLVHTITIDANGKVTKTEE